MVLTKANLFFNLTYMRTFLLLALFTFAGVISNAQKRAPEWVDPYKRESKYPANRYLVGLSSELVAKGQSLTEIYKQLNQMSETRLLNLFM